jgi:hypothetical protein
MLGKVLGALMLDQLEYEVYRVGLVNALIEQGTNVYGQDFLEKINVAVRKQRGVNYQRVETTMLHPSQDIGKIAADCYWRKGGGRSMGVLPGLLTRFALKGVPKDEADLLSYLLFDRCFTGALLEMGREDARRQQDEILALLDGRRRAVSENHPND